MTRGEQQLKWPEYEVTVLSQVEMNDLGKGNDRRSGSLACCDLGNDEQGVHLSITRSKGVYNAT